MKPEKMVKELLIALQMDSPVDLKDAPTEDVWVYLLGIIAARTQMTKAAVEMVFPEELLRGE